MENARFLECLDADYRRLREVLAGTDPGAKVPSCPEWTATDLLVHMAHVYLHKAESMRLGHEPEVWPPDHGEMAPLDLLASAYADLTAEFAARAADEVTRTWYEPDYTVAFWIRRMAQETVIHRIDAELTQGAAVAPIPDDLAVDGVDEVLVRFLGYFAQKYPEDFTASLSQGGHGTVRVETGAAAWLVRLSAERVEVGADASDEGADAVVSGPPADVLRWLWNRGGDAGVRAEGNPAVVATLRRVMANATE